jgi:hypothetical protein
VIANRSTFSAVAPPTSTSASTLSNVRGIVVSRSSRIVTDMVALAQPDGGIILHAPTTTYRVIKV